MNFLKNHPFAVEAFFEYSVVLTYAVEPDKIADLLPKHLALQIHNGNAFIAVAMVKTKTLRPKGFPDFLGNNFFLIGYRLFVEYINTKGKRLRGLYILKSETNKTKMEWLGNFFTHYNYSTTDIEEKSYNGEYKISSTKSGLKINVKHDSTNEALPINSPFLNLAEARRYAGPLPFTFSFNNIKNEMTIIEGVRTNWQPKPLQVLQHECDFINKLHIGEIKLANAFLITNVPYYWKKGVVEKLH